jgi:hypothetical protein
MRANTLKVACGLVAVLAFAATANGAEGYAEGFHQRMLNDGGDVLELSVVPPGGGAQDDIVHLPASAYFGGTPTPSYNYPPKILASTYLGGWLAHMYVIYYEDAWYWETYAGPYAYQAYHWDDLGALISDSLTLESRYATLHNFDLYAWDNSAGAWDYIGTTGQATTFQFNVGAYVNNGHLHILCYYGYQAYGTTHTSFINAVEP